MLSYTAASMTTMLLCGLWHGATWGFVIWGGLHGAWLVLERLVMRRSWYRKTPRPVLQVATFLVVTVAWVFFRTPTLGAAGHYLAALVGLGGSAPTAPAGRRAALHATPPACPGRGRGPRVAWRRRASGWPPRSPRPGAGLAVATLWLALVMLAVQSHTGFLYAVF